MAGELIQWETVSKAQELCRVLEIKKYSVNWVLKRWLTKACTQFLFHYRRWAFSKGGPVFCTLQPSNLIKPIKSCGETNWRDPVKILSFGINSAPAVASAKLNWIWMTISKEKQSQHNKQSSGGHDSLDVMVEKKSLHNHICYFICMWSHFSWKVREPGKNTVWSFHLQQIISEQS